MKYVAYYRVSTKKQGESGLGLESQKMYCHNYHSPIVEEFTETMSGATVDKRPELQKAVALCKENGYTLVVAKIDRLSRNTEDTLRIYETLGKRLRSCDIPGQIDKFTLTMFAAIAERERELVSLRTKGAWAAKKKKEGKVAMHPKSLKNLNHVANAKKSGQARKRRADEDMNNRRAEAMITQFATQRISLRSMADRLNASGFKTSTGGQWSAKTVRDKQLKLGLR